MRMLLIALVAVTLLSGCSTTRKQAMPPKTPVDVVDKDFTATISTTGTPFVYMVTVKRVNSKADKKISSRERVIVDLTLKDSQGKVYTGGLFERAYAEEVNYEFDPTDKLPELPTQSGRVRLIKKGLPPGTYTVKPNVRIVETGKDAIHGPYTDMGSVAVPAGNSIQVTITK